MKTGLSEFTNGYEFSSGTGYQLPEYPSVVPPAVKTGEVEQHDIVIVGGGLSGLTLACSLANLGVRAVLIDEDNTVGVKGASSRGICYTQKSLEIFHKLGIYERIKAKGIEWSVGRTFAGDDEVYSFDLKTQGNFNLSEQPPFINIQQFYNEGYLVERIYELNAGRDSRFRGNDEAKVELRWGNKLAGLAQQATHWQLDVQTPEGNYPIHARYVVDCTGSASPIRKLLNVPFTAKRGDDRWCIADVRFKNQPPTERHTWIEAPFNDNRAVWQHLMADQVWRIDYQMAPGSDPAYVSREDVVRARLAKQFGAETEIELVWVGPYAYRGEVVDNMIVKNGKEDDDLQSALFFMGDTAKVVSPFGARGGNTGIADADNLAWKLAAVMKGESSAHNILQSYHDERHEAAVENVKVTHRTGRFLRPQDGMERTFRSAAIALAKQYPFAKSLINTGRMAIANPYTQSKFCIAGGGFSVQNVTFEWVDGSNGCVNDLLNWAGTRHFMLWFGRLNKHDATKLAKQEQSLNIVQVVSSAKHATYPQCIVDRNGKLRQACRINVQAKAGIAMIRPDSYVMAKNDEN